MQASIRRRLVFRLMPALAVVLIGGAVAAYSIAQRAAMIAYDQALLAAAADFALGVRSDNGEVRFELAGESERILRRDIRDDIFFLIRTTDGRFVAGDRDLSDLDPAEMHPEESVERTFRKSRIRMLSVRFDDRPVPVIVTVAETLYKRNDMVTTILLAMLVPETLMLVIAALIVWFAVERGLLPLRAIEKEIAARSRDDLSPIDPSRAPAEVKALIDALNAMLMHIDEATSAEQRFIENAAHQLRTPLAGIQTQIDMLPGAKPSDLPGHIARLRTSVTRTVRLANQLLALARAEPHGAARPAFRESDLAALMRESADAWVHRAIEAGIDFGFELQPAKVRVEPFLFRELIDNLIDNAMRYTPRDGAITVSTGQRDGRAWLSVEDNGPGIPEAYRERVLERFVRVPGTPGDGSGLGLAIVAEIARVHDASIRIGRSNNGGALIEVGLAGA